LTAIHWFNYNTFEVEDVTVRSLGPKEALTLPRVMRYAAVYIFKVIGIRIFLGVLKLPTYREVELKSHVDTGSTVHKMISAVKSYSGRVRLYTNWWTATEIEQMESPSASSISRGEEDEDVLLDHEHFLDPLEERVFTAAQDLMDEIPEEQVITKLNM
jgi:hypothetical protein